MQRAAPAALTLDAALDAADSALLALDPSDDRDEGANGAEEVIVSTEADEATEDATDVTLEAEDAPAVASPLMTEATLESALDALLDAATAREDSADASLASTDAMLEAKDAADTTEAIDAETAAEPVGPGVGGNDAESEGSVVLRARARARMEKSGLGKRGRTGHTFCALHRECSLQLRVGAAALDALCCGGDEARIRTHAG